MKNLLKVLAAVFLLAAANVTNIAQQPEINDKFRRETIESLLRLLKDKYTDPEIATKMETAIGEKLRGGEYDSINDGDQFAVRITADLRAVFDDKHLRLSYSAEPIAENSDKAGAPSLAEIERARRRQSRENFGAPKVEILAGNVGLIELKYFAPLDWSADFYAAAMNYVAETDALIIDVRKNSGSHDINTIPYFCSFLFEHPVQISDIFRRETNETRQLWTYAHVPGKKYPDKPVYVLTSGKTASGAETFVSALKRLKRAVIIGETTEGATLPGMSYRVNEHFSLWISTGRSSGGSAVNENKGIVPDIAVAPENALSAAHLEAVNQILRAATDDEWIKQLDSVRAEIERKK